MRLLKDPPESRILRIINSWQRNRRGRSVRIGCLIIAAVIGSSASAQALQTGQASYAQQQQQQYQQQQDQPSAPVQRPATAEEQQLMLQHQEQLRQQQPQQRQAPGAAGQAPAGQSGLNYAPQLPEGFPISPEEEQYINQLLDHWQASSQQIKRSKWDFERWDYDPLYCEHRDQNGQLAAFNFSRGQIRFSSPDKGRFDTTQSFEYYENAEGQPDYRPRDGDQSRERWICDGSAIYQFDYANQKIYQTDIPAELQGQGLANSPLPFFLFGANRQQILDRYWIHEIQPEGVENEYWLEAWPKRIEDARNYKKLDIVISREDFLPSSLHMYASNYDATNNPVSRVFAFDNRVINDMGTGLQDFLNIFVRPPVPPRWKLVNSASLAAEARAAQTPQTQPVQPQQRR